MKLFISNKDSFLKYLGNEECKTAHKEAFKELQNELITKKSVPLTLFTCVDEIDYLFRLVSCDVESDMYVYEFDCSIYTG